MLIEFVGFPGSGKTSIIVEVAKRLNATATTGADRFWEGRRLTDSEVARERIRGALTNPALAWWVVMDRKQVQRRDMANLLRRNLRAEDLRTRAGIQLFDEGPRHRLARMVADGATHGTRIAARLCVPDAIVVVEADPQLALYRLKERGNSPELRQSDATILERHERYRAFVRATLTQPGICPTLTVDVGKCTDPSAAVTEWIAKVARHQALNGA